MNGAFWQSSTSSITSADNAFGTGVAVVSSAPFAARRMVVTWNTNYLYVGCLQITVGSTVVVPFLQAMGSDSFLSSSKSLDIFVPAGASITVSAATYNGTGTYNVSILLFSENDRELANQVISPGVSLSNANFAIANGGASVWTALGGSLTQWVKRIEVNMNSGTNQYDFSLGFGTSSPPSTIIMNSVPALGNYFDSYDFGAIRIPPGQTLYAMQSVSGGSFWPLITI